MWEERERQAFLHGTPMTTADFYQVLGVRHDATPEEIRAAYYRLARTCHPDVSTLPDAEERMRRVNEAYELLSDPERRAAYDRKRGCPEPAPARRAWEAPSATPPRSQDPRFSQRQAGPVPPQHPRQDIPFAAVCWIAVLLAGLLIVMLIGAGTPPTVTDEIPEILTPEPTVVAVITTAAVQKTFEEWKQAGEILRTQGRNGDALAAYDRALAIRPNASDLWVVEGDVYSHMGSIQKARSSYGRAVSINASTGAEVRDRIRVLDNFDTWMERADLLVEQGDYAEAVGVYDTILAPGILSGTLQKRVLSAKVYALMRAGRDDEAAVVSGEIRAIS